MCRIGMSLPHGNATQIGYSKSFSNRPYKTSKVSWSLKILISISALLVFLMIKLDPFGELLHTEQEIFEHEHEHPELRPVVISGPSGVGKGTLINMLVEYYNQKVEWIDPEDHQKYHPLSFSVSHTTRAARPGEVDGVHYHFSTREILLQGINDDQFIEHAEVHGNIYGTSYEAVQREIRHGKVCILDIDIQGAKRVQEDTSILPPHFVFIAPPSMKILEKRLRDRGTETEEAIQRRLGNAQRELDYGTQPGNFDDIVINDDLNKAFHHLRIILEGWYPHLNQVLTEL